MPTTKGSLWVNKKYANREYRGTYSWHNCEKTEREFILVCTTKTHHISFESHQMAKSLGWKKV